MKKLSLFLGLLLPCLSYSQTTPANNPVKPTVITNPITKKHSTHKASVGKVEYFNVGDERIKFAVFHADTIRINDTAKPFVTSVAEYVWDTINSGYLYMIREERVFCNGVNPEILQADLKNMLSIIPENGFKHLDKEGGEFRVNIEEALYDGGEDSIFLAVDIQGYIGGPADFEEHGVVGMRYADLLKYNDSLYKSPDHYPMNRFNKEMTLR
jgi:hypothetical protein